MVEYAQCPKCKRIVNREEIIVLGGDVKEKNGFFEKIASSLFIEKEIRLCVRCLNEHNQSIDDAKN